jgi:hypothetical protein
MPILYHKIEKKKIHKICSRGDARRGDSGSNVGYCYSKTLNTSETVRNSIRSHEDMYFTM